MVIVCPAVGLRKANFRGFFFDLRSMDSHATGVLVSPRLGVLETRRFGRELSALYRPPPSPLSLPRPPSSVASSLVAPAV